MAVKDPKSPMGKTRCRGYRAMAGLQLQAALEEDNDKVMRIMLAMEKWIERELLADVNRALEEMKATPLLAISCNLTGDEIHAYRMLSAEGMLTFRDGGVEAWKIFQVETMEAFVQGLLEERLLQAIRPFITMRAS